MIHSISQNPVRQIEIMAPAGDWASLRAALQSQADSVYFGVEKLNMRARSTNNFTLDDLSEIAHLCNSRQTKTYLTLNTVLYDEDLPVMKSIIDCVKETGIHAIIASDLAAIQYAKQNGVAVHISTQSNISNIDMVEFYSRFADVMVLARELSLKQVQYIAQEIKGRDITGPSGKPVQIEIFAHGALCMAVSGKCYLSLHTYHSSANRGECKQNCRHQYKVTAGEGDGFLIENEYIMSPKDLCTIDFLDLIIDAGVTVLKIEGRGRSPEYVKTVTRCYKEAADAVMAGNYTPDRIVIWKKQLSEVYNRGFWDGYYLGNKMGEWSKTHGSSSAMKKVFVGNVLHYYPKAGVAHIRIKTNGIKVSEPLLIIGKTTGVVETSPDSIWVNDQPSSSVNKGEDCTILTPEKVRKGDAVYIWRDRRNHISSMLDGGQPSYVINHR